MSTHRLLTLGLALALSGCPTAPAPDPLPEAPQVVSFTASPSTVARGGTVTLKWKTANAPTVDIVDLTRGSLAGAADKAEGELQVPVTEPTVFVISAKNARGARASSVASVNVEGVQAAGIVFAAYPAIVGPGRPGLLIWNAPQAKQLRITPMGGAALDLKGQLVSGSVEVNPTALETSYVLTADGESRTVTLVRGQAITEFTSSKVQVQPGDSLTLAWKTENATKVRLSSPGRGVLREITMGAELSMGSFMDTIAPQIDGSAINYVLEAEGRGALETKIVTVYFGREPQVLTATAPKYVKENLTFTLAFTTVGADRLEVRDGQAIVYRSPDGASVAAGSVELPAPATATDFVVAAISARSNATATKTVRVTTVRDVGMPTLTANPTTIAAGGTPVTLTWSAPNAARARIIEDGETTVMAIEGPQAVGGTVTVYPNKATTRYQLSATNTLEPALTASAPVTVTAPASARAADGGTVYQSQGSTQLSWTVGGATSEMIGFGTPRATVTSASTGFTDISMTGTRVPFARSATDAIASFTPIDFETFLGNRRTENTVWVSTNGFLQFATTATNSRPTPAAIPGTVATTVPEDLIAPLWADLELGVAGDVYWTTLGDAPNRELIVQWSSVQVRGQPNSRLTFQARVHQSGAVTFEYQTITTTANAANTIGYQGPLGLGYSHAFTMMGADGGTVALFPPSNTRVAFGQAQRAPAIVSTLAVPGAGHVRVGTGVLRLGYDEIVKPTDVLVTEVMNRPNPAVPFGQWIEIGNFSNATIDLSGWQVATGDGGVQGQLGSGVTLAPRSYVVVAQNADPLQNDGLPTGTAALSTLALQPAGGTLLLSNAQGFSGSLTYPSATQGVSISLDRGPFVARNATSTAPFGTGFCNARSSQTFGNLSPSQRGTPGASGDGACIGYTLETITPAFKDISTTGTLTALSDNDDGIGTVSISSAPINLFGRSVTTLTISSNGFIVPNTATGTVYAGDSNLSNKVSPNTDAPDVGGVLAPFWDDLRILTARTGAGVLSQRFAAGQDPNEPRAHWIVQWNKVEHYLGNDEITFEVKLFDNGDVEFHYATLTSGSSSNFANGNSATVWFEQDGTAPPRALVYSVNSPRLRTSTALRFTRVP